MSFNPIVGIDVWRDAVLWLLHDYRVLTAQQVVHALDDASTIVEPVRVESERIILAPDYRDKEGLEGQELLDVAKANKRLSARHLAEQRRRFVATDAWGLLQICTDTEAPLDLRLLVMWLGRRTLTRSDGRVVMFVHRSDWVWAIWPIGYNPEDHTAGEAFDVLQCSGYEVPEKPHTWGIREPHPLPGFRHLR